MSLIWERDTNCSLFQLLNRLPFHIGLECLKLIYKALYHVFLNITLKQVQFISFSCLYMYLPIVIRNEKIVWKDGPHFDINLKFLGWPEQHPETKAVDSTPKYFLLAGDTNQASTFSSCMRYKWANSIDWSTKLPLTRQGLI